jgi:hypothetical protein
MEPIAWSGLITAHKGGTMEPQTKANRFHIHEFYDWLKKLNTAPRDMSVPWQRHLSEAFNLSTGDDRGLSEASQDRGAKIFAEIEQHREAGGEVRGRIELLSDSCRRAVVELFHPSAPSPHFVIVSCDANCRNWEWF